MRIPRRLAAALAVSTLLGAGLAGCSGGKLADDTDVVVGADLAVTSASGSAYLNALQLRIAQINASGQLGKRRLVLRSTDNRSDTSVSGRNISTLADDPSVAAIVAGGCDECSLSATRTINAKRVPTIALAAADSVTDPVPQHRWTFRLGPNAGDSSPALVAELQRTKAKKVAVLYVDNLYGKDINATIQPLLSAARIAVTATRSVKPSAVDITQTVGTLTGGKPQALLVLTGPDQALLAATSAQTAKFAGRLLLDAEAAGDLFIPQRASAAMDNATMVFTETLVIGDLVATTPAKASRQQWFRDYTSRYGRYSGVAAFAADAADLIAAGVERAGLTRSGIRDVIETSQIDGLSGPIRFTPDNHSGLMPQAMTLLVARSGRWRLVGSQLS